MLTSDTAGFLSHEQLHQLCYGSIPNTSMFFFFIGADAEQLVVSHLPFRCSARLFRPKCDDTHFCANAYLASVTFSRACANCVWLMVAS
jgi:hypothetical protein